MAGQLLLKLRVTAALLDDAPYEVRQTAREDHADAAALCRLHRQGLVAPKPLAAKEIEALFAYLKTQLKAGYWSGRHFHSPCRVKGYALPGS